MRERGSDRDGGIRERGGVRARWMVEASEGERMR